MPYIKQEKREEFADCVKLMNKQLINNPGDLNYLVTILIKAYWNQHDHNYQACNDIVGALDNAKDEFKRRKQDYYEDTKIDENGDVW